MIEKGYRRAGAISILSVLFLIFVGGIVRSTGAGMGCPDWPKCFGMWVPPTSESQLPSDWKERYGSHGYATAPFNIVKTWTEYLNRLIGVLIGFSVFIAALFSVPLRKRNVWIPILSFTALIATAFEGWLGAKVVELNLAGWMVTVHMLFALIILGVLSLAWILAGPKVKIEGEKLVVNRLKWIGVLAFFLTTLQILIGTQVREGVDSIAESQVLTDRAVWLQQIPFWFALHKISFLISGLCIVVFSIGVIRQSDRNNHRKLAYGILIAFFAEAIAGMGLSQFALPFWLQPIHLLIASFLFIFQFHLLSGMLLASKLSMQKLTEVNFKSNAIAS